MKPQIRKYCRASDAGHTGGQLDDRHRESLIRELAPLVKYIADRMAMQLPAGISRDDLISAGILGLNEAIDRFQPDKNVKFKTFATYRIKGAMVDEVRKMGWASRSVVRNHQRIEAARDALKQKLEKEPRDVEIARHLGISLEDYHKILWQTRRISLVSLDEVMPGGTTPMIDGQVSTEMSPLDALTLKQMKELIAGEISTLSKNEQIIISLYYYEELTLKEIGAVLDLTESRISQIHSKILSKFRIRLQAMRDRT
ncbi:MAG: FliA/WhiG family RNA polymerase sigma factor [Desulfotignum sp.]|nr:FliA/WhiG family RNA polymerase sigma factor [Desulfotignum sp.]MCF8088880.1 FliA/WhiG family RNA polymerase sigma factor [Desulfotignum sp.]MCF8136085.1 FliA/WhiG family RNA polymerase sigma factor [Desulfotignum sp.]